MIVRQLATLAVPIALVSAIIHVACDPASNKTGVVASQPISTAHQIRLRNRTFTPEPTIAPFLASGHTHGVLQLFDRPRDRLQRLSRLGIKIHGFQPRNAYYVTIPIGVSIPELRDIGARALFALLPTDRLSDSARLRLSDAPVSITASYASDRSRADVTRALTQLGITVIRFDSPNLVVARAPPEAVHGLAQHEWVWWIEPSISELGPLLDDARVAIGADEVQAPPWGTGVPGLTGSGVHVAMWESGGAPDSAHPDFGSANGGSRVSNGEPNMDVSEHATQVAGTLVGDGTASASEGGIARQWAGIATEAVLYAYDAMAGGGVSDEVATSFVSHETVITNHSWGFFVDGPEDCAGVGTYGSHSQALDDVTTMFPITSVLAAGNEAIVVSTLAQCELLVMGEGGLVPLDPVLVAEGYGTINGQATAKNAMVVGARAKDLDVAPSSSRGPTRDGRVKPDLVAVGGTSNARLTMPSMLTTYSLGFGTSYSTPQVAGAAALLVQHYRESASNPALAPDPALLKAVLMNTAQTLGTSGPTYSRGYGVLDIQAAVEAAEDYDTVVLLDGQTQAVEIPAGPDDACELRVMAVWTDPPAMMPAADALVHDVDLSVVVPEDIVLPWTLNPQLPLDDAVRAENHIDNVEQVTMDPPLGGAQAMLVGDLPMGSEQAVVVHWYYAPCDEGSGGTGDEGGDGGDAGCAGCSTKSPPIPASLWMLFVLVRRRDRRTSGEPTGPRMEGICDSGLLGYPETSVICGSGTPKGFKIGCPLRLGTPQGFRNGCDLRFGNPWRIQNRLSFAIREPPRGSEAPVISDSEPPGVPRRP